jgi:hypothetical protein
MSKKGLRYDKLSSQNMQCKHEKIRQKSKVKNLPKLFFFSARNPLNCLCSLQQHKVVKSDVETLFKTQRTLNSVVLPFQVR